MVPAVGSMIPATSRSRVDFPHPDGPIRLTNCPRSTVNDTPLSASTGGRPGYVSEMSSKLRHWSPGPLAPSSGAVRSVECFCTIENRQRHDLADRHRFCQDLLTRHELDRTFPDACIHAEQL